MLKQLNIRLEKETPRELCNILECFVALLRQKEKATAVDVKLYFEDLGKLHYKMRTIDPTRMNSAILDKHIENLDVLKEA